MISGPSRDLLNKRVCSIHQELAFLFIRLLGSQAWCKSWAILLNLKDYHPGPNAHNLSTGPPSQVQIRVFNSRASWAATWSASTWRITASTSSTAASAVLGLELTGSKNGAIFYISSWSSLSKTFQASYFCSIGAFFLNTLSIRALLHTILNGWFKGANRGCRIWTHYSLGIC